MHDFAFCDREVAKHASEEAYVQYRKMGFDVHAGGLLEEAQRQADKRLQEELKKDALERDLRRFKNHIIENIMTDKCPTCSTALSLDGFDFNMCMALRCDSCPRGSACCGWCFAACGSDSHEHVKACPQNPMPNKNYFTTRARYFEVQRERKGQRIEAYTASQVPAHLQSAIRKEAQDLLAQLR